MKGLLFFLSAVISHSASADFLCVNSKAQMQLIENFPSHTGDSLIKLTYADGKKVEMTAQSQIGQGTAFMFKQKFSIYPHTGDMLTVSAVPSHCGRATCHTLNSHFASLKLGDETTTFNCDEIFP